MKALVTGASSGIGYEIAKYLSDLNYDLIVVARDKGKLDSLVKEVKTQVKIITLDLNVEENCLKLYKMCKDDNVDILVNNAGFGLFGKFTETDLEVELNMINTNIKAVHILTKLFLKDMKKRNSGYILNVSSAASFQPGPLMATYYATKAYVLRLTTALYEEQRREKTNIVVSVLCPGPVKTNFNNIANVEFSVKPLSSKYVAKYAINQMFKRKLIIIPGLYMKLSYIFSRFLPIKSILKITYNIQRKKNN